MIVLIAALLLAVVVPQQAVAAERCRALCRDTIAACIATELETECAGTAGHEARACRRIVANSCRAITILRCRAEKDGTRCLPGTTTTTISTSPTSSTTTTTLRGKPVALASGDLLVSDGGAGIVRVDPATGAQAIVSANADHPDLGYGAGIAVEPNGNILVLGVQFDQGLFFDVVIRINPATGDLAILSKGGGLAQQADSANIAVTPNDDILVVNEFGLLLHIDSVTGAQKPLTPGLVYPRGLAVTGNNIFVANAPYTPFAGVAEVEVDASFTVDTGLTVISTNLIAPFGIAIAGGDLVVSDPALGGIFRLNSVTGAKTTVSQGGLLGDPLGIAVAANGDIFVANASPGAVVRVDPVSGAQSTVSSGGYLDAGVGGLAIVP
jgi:hypothetical protein